MGDSVHIRPDYTTDNIDKPFILEGRRAVHSITLADAFGRGHSIPDGRQLAGSHYQRIRKNGQACQKGNHP